MNVPRRYAGTTVSCLRCAQPVVVPPLDPPSPPAAPAPAAAGPPPVAAELWHYRSGADEHGPFPTAVIAHLIDVGVIGADSPVRRNGGDWVRAADTSLPVKPSERRAKTPRRGALILVKRAAKWANSEVRATGAVVAGRAAAVHGLVTGRQERRRIEARSAAARISLGESALDQGIGDVNLRERAGQLRETIENLRAANANADGAWSELRGALLRLADDVLRADPPPPGLHEPIAAVHAVTAERDAFASPGRNRTRELLPADRPDRVRLAFAALVAATVLAGVWFALPTRPDVVASPENEDAVRSSLAFVVCGVTRTDAGGAVTERPFGTGSGFVVTTDGIVLTNRHVVKEVHELRNATVLLDRIRQTKLVDVRPTIWVFFGRQRYVAEVVYVSEKHDLAILKVPASFRHVFPLANGTGPGRGVSVSALGFPAAAGIDLTREEALRSESRDATDHPRVEEAFPPKDFEFGLTSGHVSRVFESDGLRWVQHDCAIHGGNSGGPLVTADGLVVGINTSKHKDAAGVSFAIGMAQLKAELDKHATTAVWR